MAKLRKSKSITLAFAVCKKVGCSIIGWGSTDFLVEVPDENQFSELKARLASIGFQQIVSDEDQSMGIYEFAIHPVKDRAYPLQDRAVILAPLGVRIGPLVVAFFFLIICVWAKFQPGTNLNHPGWLFAASSILICASVFSAVAACFWRIEFSQNSMTLVSIYSKKVIAWNSIARVSEVPASVGRFLFYVLIKLHDGTEFKTRNFHFNFTQILKFEIKRRLEISRPRD